MQHDRQLLDQHRVDERQQGVDRIARRAAVAAFDVEVVVALEQPGEPGEVDLGRHAFDAQQASRHPAALSALCGKLGQAAASVRPVVVAGAGAAACGSS